MTQGYYFLVLVMCEGKPQGQEDFGLPGWVWRTQGTLAAFEETLKSSAVCLPVRDICVYIHMSNVCFYTHARYGQYAVRHDP